MNKNNLLSTADEDALFIYIFRGQSNTYWPLRVKVFRIFLLYIAYTDRTIQIPSKFQNNRKYSLKFDLINESEVKICISEIFIWPLNKRWAISSQEFHNYSSKSLHPTSVVVLYFIKFKQYSFFQTYSKV